MIIEWLYEVAVKRHELSCYGSVGLLDSKFFVVRWVVLRFSNNNGSEIVFIDGSVKFEERNMNDTNEWLNATESV